MEDKKKCSETTCINRIQTRTFHKLLSIPDNGELKSGLFKEKWEGCERDSFIITKLYFCVLAPEFVPRKGLVVRTLLSALELTKLSLGTSAELVRSSREKYKHDLKTFDRRQSGHLALSPFEFRANQELSRASSVLHTSDFHTFHTSVISY